MIFIPTREGPVYYFDINGKTYRAPNIITSTLATDTTTQKIIGAPNAVWVPITAPDMTNDPLAYTARIVKTPSCEYQEFIHRIINRYAGSGDSVDMKANCEANNEMNYDTTEIDKFLDEFCARKD